MVCSRKHSCHENTKFRSLVIVSVRTYVAARNVIIVGSLDIKTQQCFLYYFSLQILLQEIRNTLKSSCIVPEFLSGFNEIWIFLTDFLKNHNMNLDENASSGSRADTCGPKDTCDIGNSHFLGLFMRMRLITGILKFYVPTGTASVTPAYTILLELLFKTHLWLFHHD